MASIIIPSRWRQQPIGLLEINWANPLARAIRLAAPLRDTKQVFSRDGIRLAATGASLGTCSRGVGAVFPGTSGNRIDLGTTPILTTGVPYTFSLLLRPATPSSFSSPLGLRFGTSAILFIRGTNEGYRATIGPLNGSVRNFDAVGAPTSGVEEHWIASNAVGPESSAVDAYFNGVSRTYLNSAYGGSTATNSYIGWNGFDDHWPGLIQNVVVWSRALSAPEAAEFYANPWQIYRKRSRVLYFEMAGGTNYTLPLDSGSFTLSGQASSLAHNKILSLAEGSFTLSGSSADLLSNKVLSLEQGSFNVSGQTADLLHNKLLSLENGSFTVTDSDATLLFNRLLELGVGSVTLSGSDATLTYTHGSTYSLVLSEGTFSLGGGSATLVHNKVIPLDSGVFTLSGSDINLIHGKNLTLEAGSFTLSGNDLTFLYNRALPLFSGSITISGGSSTLSYSGVPTISILESLKSYIETQRELKSKITIEIDLKSLL